MGGGQWWRASQRAAPRPKSLAILPFQTVGLNANEELLGLGMADALIIKLSGQQQLSVLPTSAVIKYTGQGREALSIGRSLGVESVLDGTIQRAGERVRVTLQILRVNDGQTLWTGQFDEPFTGIFAVQDAVAARISQSLALQLAHGGPTRQANTYTTNTEAYQAYLTGRFFYEKRGPEDLAQAINYLQQAVKLDPNFALGYATLADCYYLQTYYGYGRMPVSETSARVNELAQQALQLDANLAEAHIARAGVKISFEHNVPGAQAELQQALALNPSSMLAHLRYAWTLYAQGRIAETVREMRAAQELDPLSPTPNIALSSVLIMAREADEAVKYARQAVAIAPESYSAHLALGDALVIKGQFEAGINEYLGVPGKAPNQEVSATIVMSLAYAYAVAKRPSEARRYLAQMHGLAKNDYPVPPYQFAIIYAALGDHDTAFAWLEKIPESRVRPAMLRLDPQLDVLRDDPRFAALLEKYKLP